MDVQVTTVAADFQPSLRCYKDSGVTKFGNGIDSLMLPVQTRIPSRHLVEGFLDVGVRVSDAAIYGTVADRSCS